MYNTREALAYSGKLPEQQNQAAITPQLLDLLALQKVEADKKAAAQQLAMASGQPQPTVAQGLQQRAMQSARQEVAQKMGLAGLAQAQPPAGPMPQGLGGAQSNLPAEYQGGGIIAFAQGGSGGDAHGRFRQQDEEVVDGEDQPPEMSAENAEFIRSVQAAASRGLSQDPEAEAQKAIEFQQSMLSPARDAAIAHKREQQAGLKALYERQIAERPSGLRVALDRMSQNIREPGGFGAAMQGVSQAGQAAREGYTKQEIVQLNALSAIDDEIDKAIENNDVSKYNAYVGRRKEIEGQMKDALTSGTSLANVLESAQARKEGTHARIQEAKRGRIAEDTRKREFAVTEERLKRDALEARGQEFKLRMAELGGRKDADANLRRDTLAQKARTDAINYAEKLPNFAYLPPEDQEAKIQEYTRMIMGPVGKAPAAAAPASTPPPGAVRLKG
jgi:hypothetical protein